MPNPQNLIPFKPGYDKRRENNGRPKGIKSWSTVVQEILTDEKLFQKIMESGTNVPPWVKDLPTKNGATAIAVAMQIRAMSGDKQAADWLRRTGWGDKLDMTILNRPLTAVPVVEIKPRATEPKAIEHSPDDQPEA